MESEEEVATVYDEETFNLYNTWLLIYFWNTLTQVFILETWWEYVHVKTYALREDSWRVIFILSERFLITESGDNASIVYIRKEETTRVNDVMTAYLNVTNTNQKDSLWYPWSEVKSRLMNFVIRSDFILIIYVKYLFLLNVLTFLIPESDMDDYHKILLDFVLPRVCVASIFH